MENNDNGKKNENQGNGKSVMICAYAALAISVVLAILWICNVGGLTVVTLETFVGVIVALLAIIVTIAIIWKIYNAVEIKNKVEEIKQLEDRIKKQEKSLEKFKLETTRNILSLAYELMMDRKDRPKAFCFIFSILETEMQLDDSNIDLCLDTIEIMVKLMKVLDIENIKEEEINSIKESDKNIRAHSNYKFIKRRYEPFYNEFMSNVEKKEDGE